ncbi:hypothetical protein GIB67_023884 [Kingdonia uniflora]|uniref:Glucosyltransferase 24 catalytic domain-containing protein n=1 Tax=Kingdonia uniflora TaxID=39325 RepID=A0A7J7NGM1_9MAGN|nr:hypothetical protein GIB67_023884 [Kingdonia uniflora]
MILWTKLPLDYETSRTVDIAIQATGYQSFLIVSDPSIAKHIFRENSKAYSKGKRMTSPAAIREGTEKGTVADQISQAIFSTSNLLQLMQQSSPSQSLLRGRFLRNESPVVEERPPSIAARELGLLRQRHTVSGLSALLWHRLMGKNVLSTTHTGSPYLRAYSHCSRNKHKQKEKQQIIWAYKILFLDVIIPLSFEKVIFVDADQIVRTDMGELYDMDIKGKPLAYKPCCENNKNMDGYRFETFEYFFIVRISVKRVGLRIVAPYDPVSPNTDGIDPDSCTNTLIEDCYIKSGVDCVTVKSGWDQYGIAVGMPTTKLLVGRVTYVSPNSAGIVIGSEMSGVIQDVRVEDFTTINTQAGVKDVIIRRMVMKTMKYVLWMIGAYGSHPDESFDPKAIPLINNINYTDMVAENVSMTANLVGLTGYPLKGICLSNVAIGMSTYSLLPDGNEWSDMSPEMWSVSDADIRKYQEFAQTWQQSRGLGSEFWFAKAGVGSAAASDAFAAPTAAAEGDDLYS